MTIKQLGGIFGRNPEFNDIDAESLNVSGTITSNGLTVDSNTLHVDPVNNFVGIRTQFPGEALTVNGNISFAGTSRVLYNLGTADTFLQTGSGDVVVLRDNGGTETARFNSAGIGFPSGKGIDFSATSGTGTSELFDDYEEGTWTPGGAGASATGAYTKIGNIVVAHCVLSDNSVSTTSISGLPFTVGYGSSIIGGYFGRSTFGGIFDANGNEYRIRVIGTEIQFRTNVSLAGDASATVTTAGGGNVRVGITVIYMV